jgi:hypothetical protein
LLNLFMSYACISKETGENKMQIQQ